MEEKGPWLLLQLGDIANLLEVLLKCVYFFSTTRNPVRRIGGGILRIIAETRQLEVSE
jgi:hypothetical protein